MFDKSTRSKQVCQLLLSLIVGFDWHPSLLVYFSEKLFEIYLYLVF